MGFDETTVTHALCAARNDINSALEYCLNGIPDNVLESLRAARRNEKKQQERKLLHSITQPPPPPPEQIQSSERNSDPFVQKALRFFSDRNADMSVLQQLSELQVRQLYAMESSKDIANIAPETNTFPHLSSMPHLDEFIHTPEFPRLCERVRNNPMCIYEIFSTVTHANPELKEEIINKPTLFISLLAGLPIDGLEEAVEEFENIQADVPPAPTDTPTTAPTATSSSSSTSSPSDPTPSSTTTTTTPPPPPPTTTTTTTGQDATAAVTPARASDGAPSANTPSSTSTTPAPSNSNAPASTTTSTESRAGETGGNQKTEDENNISLLMETYRLTKEIAQNLYEATERDITQAMNLAADLQQ